MKNLSINVEYNLITRDTVDILLDAGRIETLMSNGKWWQIRRNGITKRWKRDQLRIYIPFKMGMYGYGAITEKDFIGNRSTVNQGYFNMTDTLDADNYRIKN